MAAASRLDFAVTIQRYHIALMSTMPQVHSARPSHAAASAMLSSSKVRPRLASISSAVDVIVNEHAIRISKRSRSSGLDPALV